MTTSNGELLGLAFMAFFIITLSSTARYYFKFFCFVAFSVVCAVGPVPLMLLRPRDYRNALIPAYLCVRFGKMLGASFSVRGKENINRSHGGIVLMNHQSALDLIVLAELWPIMGRSTVVAKKEVLYMFPFGTACWLWGTLFIDRQNRDSAKNVINKEAKAITEKQVRQWHGIFGSKNGYFTERRSEEEGSYHDVKGAHKQNKTVKASESPAANTTDKKTKRVLSVKAQENKRDTTTLYVKCDNTLKQSGAHEHDGPLLPENCRFTTSVTNSCEEEMLLFPKENSLEPVPVSEWSPC